MVNTGISKANVLDHLGVDFRLVDDLFEQMVNDELERSVFHAAFKGFSQGRPYGECDDYIVGVLLGSVDS